MEDRVPTYAGRVKLTPVTGSTDLFDMQMADEPTEVGTPLNKANLLADATAAAIAAGFGTTPTTPNEALALLAGGAKMEIQSYVGTGEVTPTPTVITFAHKPKLVFVLTSSLNIASSKNASRLAPYGAVWAWDAVVAAATATNYKQIYTGFYVSGGNSIGQNTANFTLSNSNKTISLLAPQRYGGSYDPADQLNIANETYTVISFY